MADTVFKKLVTDITYINVKNEGWTYLASVMHLFDRKIIVWSYGKNITAELATQAVKNACLNIKDTEGIILHSDLGSQYTSEEFENYLKSRGIQHSFSRKGNPYDNACIESFHSVLKKEEVYTTTYHTFEDAKMPYRYIRQKNAFHQWQEISHRQRFLPRIFPMLFVLRQLILRNYL